MAAPKDAYSKGYEEGKKSTPGGALAEITMGMMRDDPGGYFAAGYRDGAGGKEFKVPSSNVRRADAELNPFDDKVAIKTVCPNCRETDWFEWKFLGRLTDPVCGHSWYAGSGTYALMQLRAAFQFGGRIGKYMTSTKSHSSSAGEEMAGSVIRGVFWIMGALIGIGCRLEFGILMIPIQAVAGLCQSKKTNAEITVRVVALAVTLGGLGVGLYELKRPPTTQVQTVQSAGFVASAPVVVSPPRLVSPSKKVKSPARLIFGKWYPQVTFIPHAGTTVWNFQSNSQVIEYGFVDHNFNSPTRQPVVPEKISESKSGYTIHGDLINIGTGTLAAYRIVRLTPNELVLVSTSDTSAQPFEQHFAHTWQWPMVP